MTFSLENSVEIWQAISDLEKKNHERRGKGDHTHFNKTDDWDEGKTQNRSQTFWAHILLSK